MGSFDKIMRRLTSQMDSMQREKEEKGKRTALDIGIIKNEYTPDERETQARQDRLDAEGRVRGDAAVASLQRNSDAFEVSKGRMSPDLFNMQNGGGAVAGGGSGGTGGARQMVNGGTEKGAITDADLLKTYSVRAKSPDDPWSDFNGKMPDFETYKATMAGAGGATPQMSGQDYFRNEASKTRAYEKENTRPIVQSTLKDGTPKFTENSADPYTMPSAPVPRAGKPVVASARELVNRAGAGMGSRQVPYPGQRQEQQTPFSLVNDRSTMLYRGLSYAGDKVKTAAQNIKNRFSLVNPNSTWMARSEWEDQAKKRKLNR